MEVSEQIIKVLDNLCEKFGMAIDWSQENILPYVQDLSSRIVKYDIAKSCVWIVLGLLFIISGLIIIIKTRKNAIKTEKDNLLFTEKGNINSYELSPYLFFTLYGIISIIFLIVVIFNIFNIIQDLYLPEKLIVNTIKQFM